MMSNAWLVVAVVLLVAVAVLAKRFRAGRFTVKGDLLLHRRSAILRWSDLREVRIETTSDGPQTEDLWLELVTFGDDVVRFPCLEIPNPVLEHIWGLPGFDREAFGAAMRSTSDSRFTLWSCSKEDIELRELLAELSDHDDTE